jgi:hypothetical protein
MRLPSFVCPILWGCGDQQRGINDISWPEVVVRERVSSIVKWHLVYRGLHNSGYGSPVYKYDREKVLANSPSWAPFTLTISLNLTTGEMTVPNWCELNTTYTTAINKAQSEKKLSWGDFDHCGMSPVLYFYGDDRGKFFTRRPPMFENDLRIALKAGRARPMNAYHVDEGTLEDAKIVEQATWALCSSLCVVPRDGGCACDPELMKEVGIEPPEPDDYAHLQEQIDDLRGDLDDLHALSAMK